MKNQKLYVVFNNKLKKPQESEDTKIITFGELVSLVKTKNISKHFFRYKEVIFLSYRFDTIPWPFFNAALLRLLSRGKCYFEDEQGVTKKVNIFLLIKLFTQLVIDYFRKEKFTKTIENEVDSLLEDVKVKKKIENINLSLGSLYLRTDMWFGVSAGGSVGHIAGVLNNLQNFTGAPTFFTTDDIPTVKEEIKKHLILPSKGFRDFRELSSLYFNRVFSVEAQKNINKDNISFIYQRYSINNFSGVQLAEKYNVPLVIEYNGSEVWISRNWGGKPLKYERISEKIEMLNLQYAHAIVVVSQPMKDELVKRGIDTNKILVNPNGVDPIKYSPDIIGEHIRKKYKLDNKVVLGFIGTFGAWHGADILADAFGKLLTDYPEYRNKTSLLMIGDGVTMPTVVENLKKHNVLEQSILTGIVPQELGPEYLAACDILISPHVPNSDGSPFFGSPTKLFEYMAMGKGIVASDLDQIGEILEHNHTAWMVKPGGVQALVNGLKNLIDDQVLRENLGEQARQEVVEKYTWEIHTKKVIEKIIE